MLQRSASNGGGSSLVDTQLVALNQFQQELVECEADGSFLSDALAHYSICLILLRSALLIRIIHLQEGDLVLHGVLSALIDEAQKSTEC